MVVELWLIMLCCEYLSWWEFYKWNFIDFVGLYIKFVVFVVFMVVVYSQVGIKCSMQVFLDVFVLKFDDDEVEDWFDLF